MDAERIREILSEHRKCGDECAHPDELCAVCHERWPCETYELATMAAEAERYRAALQALIDVQNGPPLIKYEADWNEAMRLAAAALETEVPRA